jgi:NADH-quinone oxidoreductase subunit G
MPIIFIDNKPYEVKSGNNMLETCLALGFDLPYFCWHPAIGSVGACRQCAVKVYKDENDKKGRLIMSCMEPVTDKQRISITDPEAVEFRSNVIEWLMTNHPHDCAVCDEGGSCHLQDMTVMTGHNYRRFKYKKRTYRNQYLGPFINHEMNRCIQCYRCVRFYRDHAGGRDLDAFASKNNVYFGRHEDGILENEFSGNLSEVCPTGVFTDKTLKEHYTRKWDLTMAPTVCHHCSLGCNIIGGERYGELRVIMNRYNGDVNGYFICDRGRFGYGFVNAPDRIRQPMIDQAPATRQAILSEVTNLLQTSKKVIGIGSPRASLQSNYALKALVGEDNFYHGVSDNEHDLAELAIRILKDCTLKTASMREVEESDATFVLGEDLTNTAPRLALAVRQVSKNKFIPQIGSMGIPEWHDAAVREIIQDKKGAVYIGTVNTTKLDDAASAVYRGAPDDVARLGYAVAKLLDASLPDVKGLTPEEQSLASKIADDLRQAKKPVLISGASCESASVMKAATNIAIALQKLNPETRISFTLPECNSMGLALMGGHRLNSAFDAVLNGHADTVIVMENDLYRHGRADIIDEFFNQCKRVVVFDHAHHATADKAHVVIPAGTFAESDGILVNNEGRAQRFFQIYESTDVIQESWRWLLNIGSRAGNDKMMKWRNFEDLTKAISANEPFLHNVDATAPPADFRVSGQRIPRQTHRYSGRTSMNAHLSVSEPKPPEDPDSPLSYTMEGLRGTPPSSLIPFFWAPGWNSVQSVAKYQEEPGGPLKGGNPGIRLLEPLKGVQGKYFTDIPDKFQPMQDHLWVVPVYHIFGSEELSTHSEPVATRIPSPYILIHESDALALELSEGQMLHFEIDGQHYALPVKLSTVIRKGLACVPYGMSGLHFAELPAWANIKQGEAPVEKNLSASTVNR